MTVFFDLDDTLYDRSAPFFAAAEEYYGGKVTDLRQAYRACMFRGSEVYLPSQHGEISMDEMAIYRWGRGFADVGMEMTAAEALEFNDIYNLKKDCISLSPVMEDLLRCCAENAGIITNGPSDKQWNKIHRLGLERFMERDLLIVSGDVGIDKPDTGIFHIAEERCGAMPKELLYVGDSIENDVAPASQCGWRTVWFNRNAHSNHTDISPDITVATESELAAVIRMQF